MSFVAYVGAVVIDAVSKNLEGMLGVFSQFGHDALIAASALLLGAGGIGGWIKALKARQLSHYTGGLLLALLTDTDHLAGRLTGLVWEPGRPLLGEFSDLPSDDVWNFLRQSDEGRGEVLHRQLVAEGPLLLGEAPNPEAMKAVGTHGLRNAEAISNTADTLYARAMELSEFESDSADELLRATAELRALAGNWPRARSQGNDAARFAPDIVALTILMSEPLSTVGKAIAVTEAETEAVLKRTEQGRKMLEPHLQQKQDRAELTAAALELARISREMDEQVKSLDTGMAKLQEDLRRWQEERHT